jgi:redox-sensitive bicupin YhaK (pirin superfamily)
MKDRRVARLVAAVKTMEGEGFQVRRAFPAAQLMQLDPFLLLDEFGPVDYRPGEAKGAPDHPHRGFETVTYLLDGEFEHRDSFGGRGSLAAGDLQWMTAGSGLVHSEMPSAGFRERGGRLHGFQIWVNLPRSQKMLAPGYQEIRGAEAPVLPLVHGQGEVKVLAGTLGEASSPVRPHTPVVLAHARLERGAEWRVAVDASWTVLVYVVKGAGTVGEPGKAVDSGDLAILEDGDQVRVVAGADGLEVLLLAGQPLGEPVARYGPFVMNTKQELVEAYEDYQAGRMGVIAP